VGDSRRDLEAAKAVGARPILVRTGNGRQTEAAGLAEDTEIYDDLSAAAAALAGEG
jgi:D-glycero-D-manno-heptose 1,7-bisphosphate phosphatase